MKMKGKMNSYSIEIKETTVRCINVIAASEFEAVEKAAREYRYQGSVQSAYGLEYGYETIDFKVRERKLRNGL